MIQLKQDYSQIVGTEAHIGKLIVNVVSFKDSKDFVTFEIEDYLKKQNNSKLAINNREKTIAKEVYNNLKDYINSLYDFTGLSSDEKIWEEIRLQSLLMIQTDLFENGLTSYGRLPSDWEYSEMPKEYKKAVLK